MSTSDAGTPSDDSAAAPRDDDLAELIREVDEDPDAEGASEMSDRLRDRTPQTAAEPEDAGDLED
ncbi:hypothetical protein [Herbiconiux solani]|uniref:hypothetical protein n=1 Tax=Herbiconiux solani TaxID=661329 RepID=UPI000824E8F7|nr:hypothetical protein [Herbiconiux solani]